MAAEIRKAETVPAEHCFNFTVAIVGGFLCYVLLLHFIHRKRSPPRVFSFAAQNYVLLPSKVRLYTTAAMAKCAIAAVVSFYMLCVG